MKSCRGGLGIVVLSLVTASLFAAQTPPSTLPATYQRELEYLGRGGEFAMLESELTAMLRAQRRIGLDVVAIRHHMTAVQPLIPFLHYWGCGRAEILAKAFCAGLDQLGEPVEK